jgi:hypothetical protein
MVLFIGCQEKVGSLFLMVQLNQIPCLVEDFVFTNDGDNLGINYDAAETTYAEHNSLYTEINWFYPKANSTQIDRCVTYNYGENVWYTSSLARTTYADQGVFERPYATDYIPQRSYRF